MCVECTEMRNAYKNLGEKHKWKRSLTRRRRRWEDNINTDHREIKLESVNSTHLAQIGLL
jgi:hypothetical protein